eukprot:COSAG01_NODE_1049_length_11922_cov_10.559587_7_plen_102_part_00
MGACVLVGGWVSVGEHCKTSTGAVGVIREMYDDGHIKLQLTDCTITDWIQSKNVRQPSAKEVAAYEEASGWIKIGAVARVRIVLRDLLLCPCLPVLGSFLV